MVSLLVSLANSASLHQLTHQKDVSTQCQGSLTATCKDLNLFGAVITIGKDFESESKNNNNVKLNKEDVCCHSLQSLETIHDSGMKNIDFEGLCEDFDNGDSVQPCWTVIKEDLESISKIDIGNSRQGKKNYSKLSYVRKVLGKRCPIGILSENLLDQGTPVVLPLRPTIEVKLTKFDHGTVATADTEITNLERIPNPIHRQSKIYKKDVSIDNVSQPHTHSNEKIAKLEDTILQMEIRHSSMTKKLKILKDTLKKLHDEDLEKQRELEIHQLETPENNTDSSVQNSTNNIESLVKKDEDLPIVERNINLDKNLKFDVSELKPLNIDINNNLSDNIEESQPNYKGDLLKPYHPIKNNTNFNFEQYDFEEMVLQHNLQTADKSVMLDSKKSHDFEMFVEDFGAKEVVVNTGLCRF